MNVLKAIKNIRTRHLIEIDVDSLSIVYPTKLVVITQNMKFNTGTHGNQVDIKLNYMDKAIKLNNVERITTSIKHQDIKTCEIELLEPLNEEQCKILMELFNAKYEALRLKTSIHYNYQ